MTAPALPLAAPRPADPPAAPRPGRVIALHLLAIPLAFATAATLLRQSGLDTALSARFFDPASGHFLVSGSGWAEAIGHRALKSAVLALWLLLIAAAVAARWLPALRPHQRLLWTTVAAMGLGPALVTVLKDINSHACPWDLVQFGGSAEPSARWFVPRIEAGRCFPSGHAAAGFSLVAPALALQVLGRRRLAHGAFALTLVAGAVFGGVRLVQGAHFMSHNLWSAAVDWFVAALVFLPLLRRGTAPATPAQGHRP
ncbi:phosphatase PAP2 family protein [Piscinibacter sakaiensis]|uniref:Phosphatidic acid phosphatase type 2/haloperoxidase domain-containing protein n=1 Tax=Piscinibacter sakaiensis TaxID=1547922 RepID=A0A0K8NZ67_PISS1|nr:phosphatase PAP2 family protein [Piscinibacter sakaiensis]GAP35215.1 hypothetical protein ISF6_0806 [Piscinibacter sakaiensis]